MLLPTTTPTLLNQNASFLQTKSYQTHKSGGITHIQAFCLRTFFNFKNPFSLSKTQKFILNLTSNLLTPFNTILFHPEQSHISVQIKNNMQQHKFE